MLNTVQMQQIAAFPLNYPFIFGTDVAGTIVQLGSRVSRFKLGQRVIGLQCPLCSTKCSLAFPQTQTYRENGSDLGGSSSVGISAIQLARDAGLGVIATASVANHGLVRELGASHVFDHKNPGVVDEILALLEPGDLVVDCISDVHTQAKCGEILSRIGGGRLPIMLLPDGSAPENVEAVFGYFHKVNGLDPGFSSPEVGDAVWRKYIPAALAAGTFQTKPEPLIIKGGLKKVQEGFDILRRGVSAKKVVIEISQEEPN
ncbi:alcohol dehydrogenase [Penicillium argentinense]|uniref:Alcohol dehydrogenase n=1 Tax=Penicillium argentinense TaxID=1131581 RepID=A0A9W9FEE2_9EURO|nr:alcohol dehydrogenase [Penicillium argentinense]KAJ5098392.1 alcohol dehydrogenase [Penicillium argentinense]